MNSIHNTQANTAAGMFAGDVGVIRPLLGHPKA